MHQNLLQRGGLRLLALALVVCAAAALPASLRGLLRPTARAAAVFVVNSNADTPDADAADNLCRDASNNCTLRAAIQQSNATPGADVIHFELPGSALTIAPATALPPVTDPVFIDAATQPGYAGRPLVVLTGGGTLDADGLVITAGSSTLRGLVINGFLRHGLRLEGGNGDTVQGNYVGTDAAGTAALANRGNGIHITSDNNLIGGTSAAARNVVSGNRGMGIRITSEANATNVLGNYVGTNAAGSAPVNNLNVGVHSEGTNTVIGGLTATPGRPPGNVVTGNSSSIVTGTSAVVRGNLVGTDAAGGATLNDPSTSSLGTGIFAGAGTVVGGTEFGSRNVVSGHRDGISAAASVTIQGNYVGTDINGTFALANDTGIMLGDPNCVVGGTSPAARNVISGNNTGIAIFNLTRDTVIQGNFIGTDATGNAPLPNALFGINVNFARSTAIGGLAPGAANRIAYNGTGVFLDENVFIFTGSRSSGQEISIRGNSIHSNRKLGIDLESGDVDGNKFLEGLTPNDAGDADEGPNTLQNFPAVLGVTNGGGTTRVQGTLNSRPSTAYTLDFYANAACDPSGFGEGETHLGSAGVTTDAAGNASFDVTFTTPAGAGPVVTATATDPAGNTSEFSACHLGAAPGAVQFAVGSVSRSESNLTVPVTVTRSPGAGGAGAFTVDFSAGGTATPGDDFAPVGGTLSFAAGETSKTFNVQILADALAEEDEAIVLTLSNPSAGVVLGPQSSTTINIVDDDRPHVLSVSDAVQSEGDAGQRQLTFTLTLDATPRREVRVDISTQDGTAVAPQDYTSFTSFPVTFSAGGPASRTVSVAVIGDTAAEPDETFLLVVSNPIGTTFRSGGATEQALGHIADDDSPGIHFSAANYTVGEKGGAATITVVRRGDASSAAEVFYEASGLLSPVVGVDVASYRTDFTPAFGRLGFAPGETEKTFQVLVNDDAYVEGTERVFLSLADTADAPPESRKSAQLRIVDDEAPPSDNTPAPPPPSPFNNPVDAARHFVRQHYHDFLNREPDDAGLEFWASQIEACGADAACRRVRRVDVSAAFFLSIEFQQTGYLVVRLSKLSFTDSPARPRGLPLFRDFLRDTQGIGRGVVVGVGDWEEQLRQNTLEFARRWVERPDFVAEFPLSLTAEQFVDQLFARGGVTPTTAERDAALAAYGGGGTEGRARALLSVADSGSVYNRQYNTAFVLMQYLGYLRRFPTEPPDTSFDGFDFWLQKLDSFSLPGEDVRDDGVALNRVRRAEMIRAFIESIEYRQRFGQ